MTFVGDKGREKYLCFTWGERNLGTDEAPQMVSEKDIFECVVEKFRAHVESKRNPIRAAFVFDKRIQRPGESFDDFVTDLQLLARGLDIAETEKLIRNAIACKSLDGRVRQRCIDKGVRLTLEEAVDIGRTIESTKDSMKMIEGEDSKVSINKMYKAKRGGLNRGRGPNRQSGKHSFTADGPGSRPDRPRGDMCRRCGRPWHKPQEECPARKARCLACKKIGHFRRMCHATVHTVEVDDGSEGLVYYEQDVDDSLHNIEMLHIRNVKENKVDTVEDEWWETITIGDSKLLIQLDTGAKASVIAVSDLQKVAPCAKIQETDKRLVSYTQHQIVPKGTVTTRAQYKGKEIDEIDEINHPSC